MRRPRWLLLTVLLGGLGGCDCQGELGSLGSSPDAGTDAGDDAGDDGGAAPDAGTDAGSAPDAGRDAGVDGGNAVDAGVVPRRVAKDLWADVVIGQKDFTEINPRQIVPDKLFNVGGLVVDRVTTPLGHPGRAYVWDSGNNRILGLDLQRCYAKALGSRCSADLVLGQPFSSDFGACNRDSSFQTYPLLPPAGADTLCGVNPDNDSLVETKSLAAMAVDGAGGLYVPDVENHRVLLFQDPFGTDTVADAVWGQADFRGTACNRGARAPSAQSFCSRRLWTNGTLSSALGVALDAAGNLWVVDQGNHRVLRFPKAVGAALPSRTADLVLGQTTFTASSKGTGLNQLSSPSAAAFDATGALYVADTGNYRLLVYRPPFSSGMAGATFATGFKHPDAYNLSDDPNPKSVQVDPQGRGVWSSEELQFDERLRLWGPDGGTVLAEMLEPSARGGGSFGFDATGALLSSSYIQHDVLRYVSTPGGYSRQRVLFSPPSGMNLSSAGRFEHTSMPGIAIAANQLFAADGYRILYWNDVAALTNGASADGCIDPSTLTFRAGPFDAFASPTFSFLKASADGKVWAAQRQRVVVYQAPVAAGSAPVRTLGPTVPVLGGGQVDFRTQEISGLAPSADGTLLWVTQTRQHRVLRIRNPLTNPVVDAVLGQTSLTGSSCNQNPSEPANADSYRRPDPAFATLSTLCYPGALAIDRKGNLYVSDHYHEISGNQRLLLFAPGAVPATPSAVVFAPAAFKEFPTSEGYATWEPTFDSTNRMVVGYNPYSAKTGKWVEYFDDPTSSSTYPTGQLNDFYGWAVAATFDNADNLYVFDANRAHVLVYWKPFER